MKNPITALSQHCREMVEDHILSFWLQHMQDDQNGGFYGRMDGMGNLDPTADKGCVLNARILWSFAAAYRVLGKKEYLEAATRAMDYFVNHFIDLDDGGVFWSVDYQGRPKDTRKQFYALGFAIYGLSEYARATGHQGALNHAIALYHCMEQHAYDPAYGGYIEATTRDWQPIDDMRLSEADANFPKSQNTHLHILEPYANLYRVWHDGQLEQSLRKLIQLFMTRIIDPKTHHLNLFFQSDWTIGGAVIESYGHDIECSWLLHEAALVLGDAALLKDVEPYVQQLAEASLKGQHADGSMIHEANITTGYVDGDRHWWVQAENVVGWTNIWQHFGDAAALDRALHAYEYIEGHLVDWQDGEWYWSRYSDGTINRNDDKAGPWKCPYHNTRMCLEIIERTCKNDETL